MELYHAHGGGNPYHDPKTGRFTSAPGGSGFIKRSNNTRKRTYVSISDKLQKTNSKYAKKLSENYSNKSYGAFLLGDAAYSLATMNVLSLAYTTYLVGKAAVGAMKEQLYKTQQREEEVDPKTGFHLKRLDTNMYSDAMRSNPAYNNLDWNTKVNCTLSAATYEMRRRGYDVSAKTTGAGYFFDEFKKWFPGAKAQKVTGQGLSADVKVFNRDLQFSTPPKVKNGVDKFVKKIKKQGNGSRGVFMYTHNGLPVGHALSYEVQDDKVYIIDPQVGRVYKNPYIPLVSSTGEFITYRLDNVPFDKKAIKRCCQ